MSPVMTYWNGLLVTVEQWANLQAEAAKCEHGYVVNRVNGDLVVRPLSAAEEELQARRRLLTKQAEWWTEEARAERAEKYRLMQEQGEADAERLRKPLEGCGRKARTSRRLPPPVDRAWGLGRGRGFYSDEISRGCLMGFAPWWEDPDVQTAAEVLNG